MDPYRYKSRSQQYVDGPLDAMQESEKLRRTGCHVPTDRLAGC
jgi:hypothetical protein